MKEHQNRHFNIGLSSTVPAVLVPFFFTDWNSFESSGTREDINSWWGWSGWMVHGKTLMECGSQFNWSCLLHFVTPQSLYDYWSNIFINLPLILFEFVTVAYSTIQTLDHSRKLFFLPSHRVWTRQSDRLHSKVIRRKIHIWALSIWRRPRNWWKHGCSAIGPTIMKLLLLLLILSWHLVHWMDYFLVLSRRKRLLKTWNVVRSEKRNLQYRWLET